MNSFGILALLGSGEFTKKIADVDKFLLSELENPKIAVFPTAAGQEKDYKKWIGMAQKHYQRLGVFSKGFDVIDKVSANSKETAQEIEDYNFFVLSGGNPGYLYETLNDSLVWKKILQKFESGSILMGSSAGAMVLGKKFWSSVKLFDKTSELHPWDEGFGLVDFGVIPHYDQMKSFLGSKKTKLAESIIPRDIKIVGIDENTAFVKTNSQWLKMGKGKVQENIKSL